ncbi:hydroxyacylglutathione hydrolase [Hydrogenophilus islandicus]
MSDRLKIVPLPAFEDNYIWIVHDDKRALAVDPGDAAPVLAWLEQKHLTLGAILVTHHHTDHTGGIDALVSATGATVYGPGRESIPHCDQPLIGGERIEEPGGVPVSFDLFAIPGHTRGHLAYWGNGWLFCGDTLFSAGCGRLFEGTAEELFTSLMTLKGLPDETEVYCAHEYTLKNLAFAKWIEPDNPEIGRYRAQCQERRAQALPTLPSTIAREKAVNPFFRVTESATIAKRLQEEMGTATRNFSHEEMPAVERFRLLRALRDRF